MARTRQGLSRESDSDRAKLTKEQVHGLRRILDLDQSELGALLGVSENSGTAQRTVSQWETGRRPIPPEFAEKLIRLAVKKDPGARERIEDIPIEHARFSIPPRVFDPLFEFSTITADELILEATLEPSGQSSGTESSVYVDEHEKITLKNLHTHGEEQLWMDHLGNLNGPGDEPALLELVYPPFADAHEKELMNILDLSSADEAADKLKKLDAGQRWRTQVHDPVLALKRLWRTTAQGDKGKSYDRKGRWEGIQGLLWGDKIEAVSARVDEADEVKDLIGPHALLYSVSNASGEDVSVHIRARGAYRMDQPDLIGIPIYSDMIVKRITIVIRFKGMRPDPFPVSRPYRLRRTLNRPMPSLTSYDLGEVKEIHEDGFTSVYKFGPLERPRPGFGIGLMWNRMERVGV